MKPDRDQFEKEARDFAQTLQEDTVKRLLEAYDALTDDERTDLGWFAGNVSPTYLTRVLGMAIGDYVWSKVFDAEACKQDAKRAKRILGKRYW